MDDVSLADKARRGDRNALAILMERYRAVLFRIAYNELGEYHDAQDAVADAVVRACKYCHGVKHAEHFEAWIKRLTRNEARRIGKRRGTQAQRLEAMPEPGQAEPALKQLVQEALAELPVELALATRRFYLQGESVREIAEAMDRPEGTIKWMLSRSRAKLATILKDDFAMTTVNKQNYHAVLVAPNLTMAEHSAAADAVKRAGWDTVQVIDDLARALTIANAAPSFLDRQQLVILDEQTGSASAFELIPLLVALRKERDFVIWLLLREGRSEEEKKLAAMAAYMAGVDFLLMRPFPPEEVEAFARHIRGTMVSKP